MLCSTVIPCQSCVQSLFASPSTRSTLHKIYCITILNHCLTWYSSFDAALDTPVANTMQSRCMYSVQSAFLRLQTDLDPLMKSVPTPSNPSSLPSLPAEHSKPVLGRVQSTGDMQATNKIVSHVLRKVRSCLFVVKSSAICLTC